MKHSRQFNNDSSANFVDIIYPMQEIQSSDDAIIQLYYAGLITKYATLTIYGTGAERGTWGRFANICLDGITSTVAKDALTYFTNMSEKYL
jgi:hypothetical protein